MEARELVARDGLSRSDALTAVFIKTETSANATDPRNISPRSLKFLSVLGPFVSAIEKQAKACRYLVKGLTPEERGARVSEGWRKRVIETDFSRFDMTISVDIIKEVERRMFSRAFPLKLYPDFHAAVHMLVSQNGVSDMGVRYTVAGTRASGDAHTSIANGVVNRFVIWACLRGLPANSWTSYHEGDDGVTFLDEAVYDRAVSFLAYAGFLGFKMKVITPPSIDQAYFCGRFTCTGCKREMCDIPRTLTKFHTTIKSGDARSLVLAKCLSYYATDAHTPIVGPLVTSLIMHLNEHVSARLLARRLAAMHWYDRERVKRGQTRVTQYHEILPCCRANVQMNHGWDTHLQVAYEQQLMRWRNGVTDISPIQVFDYLVDGPGHVVYDAP